MSEQRKNVPGRSFFFFFLLNKGHTSKNIGNKEARFAGVSFDAKPKILV